jgi:hypothetical protein
VSRYAVEIKIDPAEMHDSIEAAETAYVNYVTESVRFAVDSFTINFRRSFLYSGYSQSHIRKIEKERLRRSSAINTGTDV